VTGRREAKLKEHAMRTSQKITRIVTTIGIDIGKNTFHLVGFDQRGAIILQQKVSRSQLERRVANIPRCLVGMEQRPTMHFVTIKTPEQMDLLALHRVRF
jgi:transposase